MTDKPRDTVSRRSLMTAGLGLAALPLLPTLPARAQSRTVTKVLDFTTSADIAKAEAEGEFTFYSHDSEPAIAGILEAFTKDFPRIKGKYVRAQNGALYQRILSERSAGRFVADVIQFSEHSTAIDFLEKGGYSNYLSPQAEFYAPEHLGPKPGYFFVSAVTFAGIAYNTEKVKPENAPKNWKDLLSPAYVNATSVKQSNSGVQFVQWFELRQLYGDGFWKEFAKLRPRGFDSRAQLFDRLARGDDKVCAMAEYAQYLLHKEKGAQIAWVAPPDGIAVGPYAFGIVDKAPHPEAARLFMDWQMSQRGQIHQQTNPHLYYGSVRKGMPAMPGGAKLSDFKLLAPQNLDAYAAVRNQFTQEWNGMLGL